MLNYVKNQYWEAILLQILKPLYLICEEDGDISSKTGAWSNFVIGKLVKYLDTIVTFDDL